MNATPTTLKTKPRPLAVAWLLGGALLVGVTACNRNKTADEDTNPAATAPGAASTATPPADTTGTADTSTAMGDETAGTMGDETQPSTTPGATPTGATTSEMTSGPITDTQFYSQAMTGDQIEIATGKMVASTSSNADVQKLANKIVSDHEALDRKLKDASGGAATASAGTVDPSVQGKTGNELDLAYADAMVADHQKDIRMFENAAKNASSATARKLASDALPVLRDHLKRAQALQTKLSSG
jgi:putative membrane protein